MPYETLSQIPWSVTAKACCVSQLKRFGGRRGALSCYLSSIFPPRARKLHRPEELSEVLKVNGSIYMAINSLSQRTVL